MKKIILIFTLFTFFITFINCSLIDNIIPDDNPVGTTQARWTFLVFMNGDNNLEYLVSHDLNELEEVGSGDDVHVVVQADRINGYVSDDGNWTGTRRYYITKDNDLNKVNSQVLDELGELDMGDPAVLSDFLMWAHENYPADNIILLLWNHGDSWRNISIPSEQRTISDDATSGNTIEIAKNELNSALQSIVSARGPIEVIGFDACMMASWEVAHSLQGYAKYIAGSETTVYDEGFLYKDVLNLIRNNVNATPSDVADIMARTAVQTGGEYTESAIDINALGNLNTAINNLANYVLNNPGLKTQLLNARDQARGVDPTWKNWYLDLNDLGVALTSCSDSNLKSYGQAIQNGIDNAVINAYGNSPYAWSGGLTIMFDFEYSLSSLNLYSSGTWGKSTAWDDLLLWLYNN